jgi:hypothetical protein
MTTTFCNTPIPNRGPTWSSDNSDGLSRPGLTTVQPILTLWACARAACLEACWCRTPSLLHLYSHEPDECDGQVRPFDGIHFLHNLPPVHLPHEKSGFVRRKAHNLYRKAVHAGKWQNFAAGIGTGAAYASCTACTGILIGLRSSSTSAIESSSLPPFILYYCTTQTRPFFHKRCHILRQSDTIDHQHTVCVPPGLCDESDARSHHWSVHLRKDIVRNH